MRDPAVDVVKVGGSILRTPQSYRHIARYLAGRVRRDPGTRLVVVVSAEFGLTDALLDMAREFTDEPDRHALDLLWSTGELRSVALLTLALQHIGVVAAAANVHQTGLAEGVTNTSTVALRLRALLATADAVVAPGFLARGTGDTIVSLGRGGSDLTAVVFAAALRARSCDLLKDVPGYFTADPVVDADARHVDALAYEDAIALAESGCELVQAGALDWARRHDVPLVIRAIDDSRCTRVSRAPQLSNPRRTHGILDPHHPCRAAV